MSNLPLPGVVDATGVGDTAILPAGSTYLRTVNGDKRSVVHDGVTPGGLRQVTQFPSNAFVALTSKYFRAHGNYILRFWYSTGNHIYPIIASGSSPINGQANTAAPTSQTGGWTFAVTSQPLYERWKIAQQMGDTVAQTALASMIATNWAFFQTSWSVAQIKAMTPASGIIYSSDDGFHILAMLREIIEVTGDATAQSCLIEAFANLFAQFLDPLQTGADLIDSGYTTPGGTRFKWNNWGIIYNFDFVTWGCISSIYEARAACVAAWMSQQAWVPAAYQTALNNYAVGMQARFYASYRSPAPATATKAVQGIYGGSLELDPNVNADNNPAVNGGLALKGSYDTNQRYHTPHNAYFDRDIRSITAWHDGGTIWVANLNYDLWKNNGTQACLVEFNSICTAFLDRSGFGRNFDGVSNFGNLTSLVDPSGTSAPYNGVTCFGNLADPWTNGMDYGYFMRHVRAAAAAQTVAFNYNPIKQAFCATARNIAAQAPKGYLTADWSGDEYAFLDGSNNWVESHTKGFGGNPNIPGTGFGNPKQGMTMACALVVMSAAAQLAIANDASVIQSGLSTAMAIETLTAELPAILAALNSKSGSSGSNIFANFIGMGKAGFRMDVDSAGYPILCFDSLNLYLRGDYVNGYLAVWQNVGGVATETFRVAAAGTTSFGTSYIKGNQYGDNTIYLSGSLVCGQSAFPGQLFVAANVGGAPGMNLGYSGYSINCTGSQVQLNASNAIAAAFKSGGMTVYGTVSSTGDVLPVYDNQISIGGVSLRYKQVYAVNATIQTSDEREKTWVASGLSDAEYAAGLRVLKEVGTFRWISNGDRIHFGVRAQQVWGIFNDEGLNPGNSPTSIPYSFLTYEAWDATPGVDAIEAVEEESHIEMRDMGDGTEQPVKVVTREAVHGQPAIPAVAAGDRYGVRQEIDIFLLAVTNRRQDELDKRISALEAK